MRRSIGLAAVLTLGCAQEFTLKNEDDGPADDPDTGGAGIDQPDIEITPAELRFGARPPGCEADPQVLEIANVGTAPLEVTSLALTGPHAAHLTIEDITPRTIRPGRKAQVTVRFTPPDIAIYDRANVRVESNDPDEPAVRVPAQGEGSEYSFDELLFVQEQSRSVDILWVFDNSDSIIGERNQLVNRIGLLIQGLIDIGLDFQFGIINTDTGSGVNSAGVLVGPVISSSDPDPAQDFRDQMALPAMQPPNCDPQNDPNCSTSANYEKAFDASWLALEDKITWPNNMDLIRDDATLAIVALSDEDDNSTDPYGPGLLTRRNYLQGTQAYVNWLRGLKPDPDHVSFSGMVGPDRVPNNPLLPPNTCAGGLLATRTAAPSARYHAAIKATGGVWGDLCQFDIDPFLNRLAYVAAGLEVGYELPNPPVGFTLGSVPPDAIRVQVNGVEVPNDPFDGWTYDLDTNRVEFHGSAIPQPGETITITYAIDDATCVTSSDSGDTAVP